MLEAIIAIIVAIILFHKISILQDKISVLEKKQNGQSVMTVHANVQNQVASVNESSTVATAVQVVEQNNLTAVGNPAFTTTMYDMPPADISRGLPTKADNEEWWGKALGISGVVAVILGISFFLKYAFTNNLIGVTGRVMIGLIAGILFISVGQYLREKYRSYSNVLMGCGIGLLYLTTFASFAFYNLISSPVAYGLLIGITALSVVLSIIDNAMPLATIGVFGGFLTPLFISLSNASLAQILAYVLILDIGVMTIAYIYKWRKLVTVAFVGTWLIVFNSFIYLYTNTDKPVMCLFLFLYYIIFLASSIFHHIVRKEQSDTDDLGIILINAFAYTGVTYSLLYDVLKNSMGFFMIIMALIYFGIAFLSFKTNKENKLLNMFLPAMSALFLSLAIPAQLHGPWISLAWFVEALILYILDYNLKAKNLYVYGAVVFVVSAIYTVAQYADVINYGATFRFIFNERFFVFLVGIITAYILAYIIKRATAENVDLSDSVKKLVMFYFVIAQIASIFVITSEISQLYSSRVYVQAESLNKEIAQMQQDYYSNNSSDASRSMTQGEIDQHQQMIQVKYNEISNLTNTNANQRNTAIDIVWVIYSLIAFAIGFGYKSRAFRTTGLFVMAITALKFFVDMWSLGPIYRIITSLVFGVIALIASFVYAKYRNKLQSPSNPLTGTMAILLMIGMSAVGLHIIGSPTMAEAATDKNIIETSPYRVEINSTSLVVNRPARFVITPDIEEKTNMTDLRVFTGIGTQVPYTLSYSNYGTVGEPVSLAVQNLSERNGQLIFSLKNKNSGFTHNGLNFSLDDSVDGVKTNFRYAVEVYGADNDLPLDNDDWRKLSLGNQGSNNPEYIFNFYDAGSQKYLSNLSVSYEPSSSRFIKVVLTPYNPKTLGNQISNASVTSFKPKNVSFSGFATESALVQGLSGNSVLKNALISENSKTNATEINVDFLNKGSITDRVYFTTTSSNFYRHVVVQAKNDYLDSSDTVHDFLAVYTLPENGEWQTVGDGNIYSFTKDDGSKLENLSVAYRMSKAAHYRFIISNLDNEPPVIGKSVTFNSPAVVLTFVPRSSGPFYLYFGGNLASPVYDIDAVLANNSLKESDISTVSLAGIYNNPLYKAPAGEVVPFTEKYPWILNGVLVLLIIFIATLIISYVRKVKRS